MHPHLLQLIYVPRSIAEILTQLCGDGTSDHSAAIRGAVVLVATDPGSQKPGVLRLVVDCLSPAGGIGGIPPGRHSHATCALKLSDGRFVGASFLSDLPLSQLSPHTLEGMCEELCWHLSDMGSPGASNQAHMPSFSQVLATAGRLRQALWKAQHPLAVTRAASQPLTAQAWERRAAEELWPWLQSIKEHFKLQWGEMRVAQVAAAAKWRTRLTTAVQPAASPVNAGAGGVQPTSTSVGHAGNVTTAAAEQAAATSNHVQQEVQPAATCSPHDSDVTALNPSGTTSNSSEGPRLMRSRGVLQEAPSSSEDQPCPQVVPRREQDGSMAGARNTSAGVSLRSRSRGRGRGSTSPDHSGSKEGRGGRSRELGRQRTRWDTPSTTCTSGSRGRSRSRVGHTLSPSPSRSAGMKTDKSQAVSHMRYSSSKARGRPRSRSRSSSSGLRGTNRVKARKRSRSQSRSRDRGRHSSRSRRVRRRSYSRCYSIHVRSRRHSPSRSSSRSRCRGRKTNRSRSGGRGRSRSRSNDMSRTPATTHGGSNADVLSPRGSHRASGESSQHHLSGSKQADERLLPLPSPLLLSHSHQVRGGLMSSGRHGSRGPQAPGLLRLPRQDQEEAEAVAKVVALFLTHNWQDLPVPM
jgi:hypothetical protein